MKPSFLATTTLLFSLVILGCSGCSQTTLPRSTKPVIVTSIPIIESLTLNVVGDQANVYTLLPAGASPHDYALTPSDIQLLNQADLILINGLDLEHFLEGTLASLDDQNSSIVAVSDSLPLLTNPELTTEDHYGAYDPHVWLSPVNAQSMVDNIATAVSTIDPEHTSTYETNAANYKITLQQLHEDNLAVLQGVGHKNFIALHPAWAYFAQAYQLNQVAAIEEIHGQEPSAQQVVQLIQTIHDYDVPALLSEPQLSSAIVESLAQDTGRPVYSVDPEGTTFEQGATMYETLLRQNVTTFAEALQ